jgi:hypothetical protein
MTKEALLDKLRIDRNLVRDDISLRINYDDPLEADEVELLSEAVDKWAAEMIAAGYLVEVDLEPQIKRRGKERWREYSMDASYWNGRDVNLWLPLLAALQPLDVITSVWVGGSDPENPWPSADD